MKYQNVYFINGNAYAGKSTIVKKLAEKYNVMSIPTLIVFKDGKIVNQMVGAKPKNQILDMIK